MKYRSKKTEARWKEVKPFREQLIRSREFCACCNTADGEWYRIKGRTFKSKLCCHEIANGPSRQKALDKPYAILVLCQVCHPIVQEWKEDKQLALLRTTTPEDYDLKAYLELTSPNAMSRITEDEVLYQVSCLRGE